MSTEFVWEDRFSVGNPVIDGQHKGLFELGNSLPEISAPQILRPIIMRLFKYTEEHFASEEALMESTGFPHRDEHVNLHRELIARLEEVTSEPLDTDEAVAAFKAFVHEWLVDHILREDAKFFEFSNA